MSTAASPADVVRGVANRVSRLLTGGLPEGDREGLLDELAGLYSEETDVRHPFAPIASAPLRSREQVRRHFANASALVAGVERFHADGFVVHETSDPEVVVVEFHYVGTSRGRSFDLCNIFVVRVRDSKIVQSRDYSDHVGLARAFGRVAPLAAALQVE